MNIHVTMKGEGAPLVFFHGWGFDAQVWEPLVPRLSKDYCLYLVDLPGLGQTSMMSWDAFKDQLLETLPPQISLVGWSLGGLVATRLAMEEPTRVRCLVNVASSPYFIKEARWPGIDKTLFDSFYQALTSNPTEALRGFMNLQGASPVMGVEPSVTGLQQGLEWLLTWDLRAALSELRIPTAYAFGRDDAIVPRTTMMAMKRRYPQFDYALFENAGHMPFLSEKDRFSHWLMGLIK